jgi:hypothetical protein
VCPRPDGNPKPSDWWLAVFAVRLIGVAVFNIASCRNRRFKFGRRE